MNEKFDYIRRVLKPFYLENNHNVTIPILRDELSHRCPNRAFNPQCFNLITGQVKVYNKFVTLENFVECYLQVEEELAKELKACNQEFLRAREVSTENEMRLSRVKDPQSRVKEESFLIVRVIEARGLRANDGFTKPDTFVVVSVGEQHSNTSIIEN